MGPAETPCAALCCRESLRATRQTAGAATRPTWRRCRALKTKTSRRNVTVDADTMDLLARWRKDQTAELPSAGVHGLVFVRPDGQPLHLHSVSQAFDCAQRPLDVSPIRFHDLRHTHASLLLRDRVPIKVVSERLGHSNPAFTMTTYQHVLPGVQDDAAAAFGQLLASHSRQRDQDAVAA